MQRYQADHGWQTKLMPDSRALISLGLGPASTPSNAVAASEARPASSAAAPPEQEQEPSAEPGANTLAPSTRFLSRGFAIQGHAGFAIQADAPSAPFWLLCAPASMVLNGQQPDTAG